ncbi:O-antigen ligase family protein [Microcoleus sp. FACHB-831]|uniref:O-antigen ligase family protein n=1 Tax=Microcoleus sp. FACHB-831 TaxID=2692827 RepID=UPI001686A90D|nr:O-antigen ligase family protein [Microcoleus sp. FACHB-831]MBD1923313.1 O-antigen ligase family protein [Microcoleus sp. FACHB-831]
MPLNLFRLQKHSDPSLQASWNYAQLGFLIFPWFPILGAIGIFLGLVGSCRRKYRTIIRRPINWGIAIFTLWLIISACFAFNPSEAFLGLANFLPFFIFFAAYNALIQTPAQLRQLAWILVLPSVPIVILGIGQLFLGWATPALIQSIFGWVLEPKGNPVGRMASVFMYANILAGYLSIVFILALGLWIEESKRRSPQSPLTRKVKRDRFPLTPRMAFLSAAVILSGIGLIFTNSRNAWGIALIGCLAFAIYLGWRWLIGAVAFVAGSILWSAFGPSPVREWLRVIVPPFFWARLTDQMYPDRPQALERVTQWQFAWSMTQERPWTGWGLRNFTPLYQAKMNLWLGHPHSLFLMLSAETGIPGTILFCGLVGWIFAQGMLLLANLPLERSEDKLILFSFLVAFGAITLFNTADVSMFDLRVNTLGWLLLAAICGVGYKKPDKH